MWQCEFSKIRTRQTFLDFIKESPYAQEEWNLNPRNAFNSGRTGNITLFYDVKEGECIKYIDICSLYPFISNTGVMPVDHSKIYIGRECIELVGDDFALFEKNVQGLVKCEILPPRDLFHPVLPLRLESKLIFALCRTCVEKKVQTDCPHKNVEDRVLRGTWVLLEIVEALKQGYVIKSIHQIWQYEVALYNTATKTGGLFTEYINMFLKIKQKSS